MATWNATIIQRNSAGGIIKITDTIEAVTSWDAKQILASKYNVEYKDVYVGSQVFAGESSTSSSASGSPIGDGWQALGHFIGSTIGFMLTSLASVFETILNAAFLPKWLSKTLSWVLTFGSIFLLIAIYQNW